MPLRHSIGYDVIFFIALLATALALGAAKDEYFVVQKAYRGWNQLARACARTAEQDQPDDPSNVVTDNWTAVPAQWEDVRTRWEYSHLAGAAFQIMAMSALIVAALARARPSGLSWHCGNAASNKPDRRLA